MLSEEDVYRGPGNRPVRCKKCNHDFASQDCYRDHLLPYFEKSRPICDTVRKCPDCKTSYSLARKKAHKCFYHTCQNCHQYVNYRCYLQALGQGAGRKGREKISLHVFFDLECTQERANERGQFVHEPNYCVVQWQCSVCCTDDVVDVSVEDCSKCGKRQHVIDKRGPELLAESSIFSPAPF